MFGASVEGTVVAFHIRTNTGFLHVVQFLQNVVVQRSPNVNVFDRVECFLEVDGGYPKALLPFVCSLSEFVECVQMVGGGVLLSESCLVGRLVSVTSFAGVA